MNRNPLLAVGGAGLLEAGNNGGFVHDVHIAEDASDFLGGGFAGLCIDVKDGNFGASLGEGARGGLAEARGAPGNDGGGIFGDLHGRFPSLYGFLLPV